MEQFPVESYQETQSPKDFTVFDALLSHNIVEYFSDQRLDEIGMKVVREFDIDNTRFQERKEKIDQLYRLALQTPEEKDYPFPKASNIKYPLLTKAAINFAALFGPSLFKDDVVVKSKVVGSDDGADVILGPDQKPLTNKDGSPMRYGAGAKAEAGERVSEFMSIQILDIMEDWESDMEKIG